MKNRKGDGHTSRWRTRQSARKAKKTFSLSQEAVSYLNDLAKQYRSTSEALDALIREKQAEAKKERISAGIRGYYDSMGDEEEAENKAWGEFVHSQLSGE
ncbi:MAG: hypothetical protein ACRD3B_16345 [Candidatus Sulfotelmatobacter sp.]